MKAEVQFASRVKLDISTTSTAYLVRGAMGTVFEVTLIQRERRNVCNSHSVDSIGCEVLLCPLCGPWKDKTLNKQYLIHELCTGLRVKPNMFGSNDTFKIGKVTFTYIQG